MARTSEKTDLRGASVLVAVACAAHDCGRERFLGDVRAALQPGLGLAVGRRFLASREGEGLLLPRGDALAGLLPGMPLLDTLAGSSRELGPVRVGEAVEQARAILAALIALAGGGRGRDLARSTGPVLQRFRALEVVRRPLPHRFVLPIWIVEASADFDDRAIAGWGQWHPMIGSLDDLLTWATANAMATGAVPHIGCCEQCGCSYVARRPGGHRFCPDGDCRDRFWNARTGASRSRATRARQRERGSPQKDGRPRSRGSSTPATS